MTTPAPNDDLVRELREEAMRLSGHSIDRGCVDSGIAANLAEKAAAALETLAAENAALRSALEQSRDAISEYYRYWTGGETRGSYDGKPERSALWKAMYAARTTLTGGR